VAGAGPAGATAARALATRGHSVLLVDKATFPRDKACAGWVNPRAFDEFDYLGDRVNEIVECPFYGVVIHNTEMTRQAEYREDQPAGYLVRRETFDAELVRLATQCGAHLLEGAGVERVTGTDSSVSVVLSDESCHEADVLVGADGVHSVVARQAGINPGWDQSKLTVCCDEELPLPEHELASRFGSGSDRMIHLWPAYEMIPGYAWAFPKRQHVAVGLGGRAGGTSGLTQLHDGLVERLAACGMLPHGVERRQPRAGVTPAGGAHRLRGHVRGRVVLIGDAGGFAAGLTGEGIYYAMRSARCAAELIDDGLSQGDLAASLARFDDAWQAAIGDRIRDPSGAALAGLLGVVFTSKRLMSKLARAFLHGERLALV